LLAQNGYSVELFTGQIAWSSLTQQGLFLMIRRVDLSWASHARGFEIVSAPDGLLEPALLTALVQWVDTGGQAFLQHYLWGYLDASHLALIRVSPVASTNASTVQAIVLAESAVTWACDVTTLLALFPPMPAQGSACVWKSVLSQLPIQAASVKAQLYTSPILHDVLVDLLTESGQTEALEHSRAPEAEIRQWLSVFSAIPLCLRRKRLPRFATNTAPNNKGNSLRLRPAGLHASPSESVNMLLALLQALSYYRPDALSDLRLETQWRTVLLQSLQSTANAAAMAPATQFLDLVREADRFDTGMRANLLLQAPAAISTFAENERARWLRELQKELRAHPSAHIPSLWIYQLFLRPDNIELITAAEQVQLLKQVLGRMPELLDHQLDHLPIGALSSAVATAASTLHADNAQSLTATQLRTIGTIATRVADFRANFSSAALEHARDIALAMPADSPFSQPVLDRLCAQSDALALLIAAGLKQAPGSAEAEHALGFLGRTTTPALRAQRLQQVAQAAHQLAKHPQKAALLNQQQVAHLSDSEFFARLLARVSPVATHPVKL
jgi:hypothetical protein